MTAKIVPICLIIAMSVNQFSCGIADQNIPEDFTASLAAQNETLRIQGRILPIFPLNLFPKTPITHSTGMIALQRELDTLKAQVDALQKTVDQLLKQLTDAKAKYPITCPKGFKQVLRKCYKYNSKAKLSWRMARQACKKIKSVLALPYISVTNDAWGVHIKKAFPAANNFFIGVYQTASDAPELIRNTFYDINGNTIASGLKIVDIYPTIAENVKNPRLKNPVAFSVNGGGVRGAYVEIPIATNGGDWSISVTGPPTAVSEDKKNYLCQKKYP